MVNGAPVTFRLTEPEGPAEPVDLVILAVKDYAYREALEQVGRFVGRTPSSCLCSMGWTAPGRPGRSTAREKMLYASMWVDASMENGTAVYNPGAWCASGRPGTTRPARGCWPWRTSSAGRGSAAGWSRI
ncbi:MAG: hypothetical protein ACLSAF_07835 [Intestinimonas sp.]